jgi:hypothetical protein
MEVKEVSGGSIALQSMVMEAATVQVLTGIPDFIGPLPGPVPVG